MPKQSLADLESLRAQLPEGSFPAIDLSRMLGQPSWLEQAAAAVGKPPAAAIDVAMAAPGAGTINAKLLPILEEMAAVIKGEAPGLSEFGKRMVAKQAKEGTGFAGPMETPPSAWTSKPETLKATDLPPGFDKDINDLLDYFREVQTGKKPWGPSEPIPPSSAAKLGELTPEESRAIMYENVPPYLPTQIPERAIAAGYNVPLAHGTREGTLFSEFKLPEELYPNLPQVGVHAGSPSAANRFAGTAPYSYTADRVYPLVMKAQNPLELPDLGSWGPENMREGLKDTKLFTDKELEATYKDSPIQSMWAIRKLIQDKGYDSIKYINRVEDPGHISYIALDPKQLRAPWAAFKDLESRNLLSGIAGAGVVGAGLAGLRSNQSAPGPR